MPFQISMILFFLVFCRTQTEKYVSTDVVLYTDGYANLKIYKTHKM